MRWARTAVVLGALLVCAAFALGTETQPSARVDDETWTCQSAIPAGWLVSGSPSGEDTGGSSSVERRLDAACAAKTEHLRWALGGLLAVGGAMVLVGWTALRERDLGPARSTGAVVEEEHRAGHQQPQDAG